ncbi:GGDEF domain-containing protein [Corallincola holothuriorum]|uniref:diguanylate cyclase n=2 Tax=Corallincola holothuriorum TaxID=2282215 RepID=A0A368N857_9GAMM|nr:GGDEF domain-containing protein [Corallincola holothuriorum]
MMADNQQRVALEKVRQLYLYYRYSMPVNVAIALTWGAVLYGYVPDQQLLAWNSLVIGVVAARMLHSRRRTLQGFTLPARRLEWEFSIGSALMGSLWGAASWQFLPALPGFYQAFLVITAYGLVSGGFVSMITSRLSFNLFAWPTILPPLAVLAGGNLEMQLPAFGLVLFAGFFIFSTYPRMARHVEMGIRSNIKNELLVEDLRCANEKITAMSLQDALTGISNRRALDQHLDEHWRLAARHKDHIGLIMIDVDKFKDYNDELGHLAGDECLQIVAQAIASFSRRPADMAARYGGEEFVLLLPDTEQSGAELLAEEVRAHIEQLALSHPTVAGGVVTVSCGVAVTEVSSDISYDVLIKAADNALYSAKNKGRNRVELAPELIKSGE